MPYEERGRTVGNSSDVQLVGVPGMIRGWRSGSSAPTVSGFVALLSSRGTVF